MKQEYRIFADVHGAGLDLQAKCREAIEQGKRIGFLGDVMDRGKHNLGAMKCVIDMVRNHGAFLCVGNHDDRFVRYVKGNDVKITHGLQETIEEIEKFNGHSLAQQYANLCEEHGFLWHRVGDYVFTHASVELGMLDHDVRWKDKKVRKGALGAAALYGETDGTRNDKGFINRSYNWVDRLPEGIKAVVGHDIRVATPQITYLKHTGRNGGEAFFIDNGSWEFDEANYIDLSIEVDQRRVMPDTGKLIIMVGPCGGGKSTVARKMLDLEEGAIVVSSDEIRQELCGNFMDQSKNNAVFSEFHSRIAQGLWKGQTVIADATHLIKKDRLRTAMHGIGKVPVVYAVVDRPDAERVRDGGWRNNVEGLIERHRQVFESQRSDIFSGDGLDVEVIEI